MSYRKNTLVVATMSALALCAGMASASSHREAPLITEMPKVDGTDFYMFRSYEPGREGYVTFVADYIPLQDPYGGPNYFSMDPTARYSVHIDNNGDAKPDLTFAFRFRQALKDIRVDAGGKKVSIPLINAGQISSSDTSALNKIETFSVELIRRDGGSSGALIDAVNGKSEFEKPVDNIGVKSIPNYHDYANAYVHRVNIPHCGEGRVFVGQRKDPFVVNLGKVFDLVNTNPLGPVNGEKDDLADKNVTSLVMEVPISCLTRGTEPVIGAWTTADVPQVQALVDSPRFDDAKKTSRERMQVSRLGMPLVNELVIGLKDKNLFNASNPEGDKKFADYVTNPTLPVLIQTLFPSAPAPSLYPRTDLVATFLTGINTKATGNLNQPANVVPAEMLRLNTKIAPTSPNMQNNLGVIGGDLAGYPNGRRPGDDVVDISLRVVMGKLISAGLYGMPSQAPAGEAPLTDGAYVDANMFDNAFPYLRDPLPGSM